MKPMKQKLIEILRFIIILPSTILIYLIARGLFNVILYLGWSEDGKDGFMLKYLAPIIYCAIAGYYSISATVYIAPYFKKGSAIFMTIVYISILIPVIYYFSRNQVFTLSTLLEQVGMVIGAIVASYRTSKNIELF